MTNLQIPDFNYETLKGRVSVGIWAGKLLGTDLETWDHELQEPDI